MSRREPYRTCPLCGAHLDLGERCDCQDEKEEAALSAPTPKTAKVERVCDPLRLQNTMKEEFFQHGT